MCKKTSLKKANKRSKKKFVQKIILQHEKCKGVNQKTHAIRAQLNAYSFIKIKVEKELIMTNKKIFQHWVL